jgi:hypothetical protein
MVTEPLPANIPVHICLCSYGHMALRIIAYSGVLEFCDSSEISSAMTDLRLRWLNAFELVLS